MIGAQLGSWTIDKELGRGGMGRVYLAHEKSDGRQGAIKVLSAELAQEAGFLQRFQREIEVLRQLDHPNIVRFFESGAQDGIYYFAMEYLDGENFEQILYEKSRIPWKEVLDAALQICPALKHAHDRGIVHRDIKPPNLLRTAAGTVKLTDFGIAKVFAARHLTNTGGVVGTAEFLSPEQACGKQATKRSDLYSLGIVLYTMITGRTPFEGQGTADILHKHLYGQFDRPKKLVPDIPHELDDIVCQLLEKDPALRPADGLVLYKEFDRLRRKLERKAQLTVQEKLDSRTVADNRADSSLESDPGVPTLVGRLVRREFEEENRGSVWSRRINRPWVLVPLLAVCVGIIVWRVWFNPSPGAESLFRSAELLMASPDPADWDKAWQEYLEPLDRNYPDHPYEKQVTRYRQKMEDHASLRRALAPLKVRGPMSEAERFYRRGLRMCQDGDAEGARRTWQNVAVAFHGIEGERRWVELAEEGLSALSGKLSSAESREEMIEEALNQAKKRTDPAEAAKVRTALENLYRDDALAEKVLQRMQQQSGH
jgi:serine/threonine protein kinase